MKYGLLYYKDTNNIGDDIQTYAASRFMPRIDYLIDRENIESFVPDRKEYVVTIMNAWYVHDKFNFSISPYIKPLFISMFFKNFPYERGITVGIDYINEDVKRIFRMYGPIGTRDIHTKKIMDKLDIESYFSGCLTLTINKFSNIEKGDYIVAVGLTDEEINYIKSKTNLPIKKVTHDIEKYSLSDMTWEERKQQVEDILKIYQGAKMVITNKLHCTLPCLALETPVLLLYDTTFRENEDRIGSFLKYVNYIKREELFNIEIDFENPKENPKEYLELREKLIQKCEEFIKHNKTIKGVELPPIKFYKEYIKSSRLSKNVIIKHLELLCDKYEKECEKSNLMYLKIQDLTKSDEELKMIKSLDIWEDIEKKLKERL